MASINQYPPIAPPPVPPPYRTRRSIIGPAILITIGVIALLANMGVLHAWQLWNWFGHWWPLLLILWGVIALVEHASAHRMGYRTRHLGVGGILLLVLLVAVGVSAHHSSEVNWGGVRDQIDMDDDSLGGILGDAYTFDDTLEQSFPAKATLRVVCDRGAVNITPSEGNTIRVVVHKKLYAHSKDDAGKYNTGSKPQITVEGTSVLLNANTDGAGDHAVQTDMDIFIPAETAVDIAGKRGDVTINNLKAAVKISLQKGDVSVTEIAGAVQIELDKGSLRASEIAGDVDVTGHVDSVNIDDVAGAVRLNGDFYQDIRLSKIAKSFTFKTSRSDIEIASVPGDIDIASDNVRASELTGPSRVITSSKDIHLEDVSGDLQVQSGSGDVEVTTAEKNSGGKMTFTTEHGSVALTVTGKTPPEKVNVVTQHGDVTLTMPPGVGFQITADTRKGTVSSDFDSIKVSNEENVPSRANGSVGNGNSKMQVDTETGDIKIAKN